jgi:hypothetical protein
VRVRFEVESTVTTDQLDARLMYIGGGFIVLVLIIILIVVLVRR